MGIAFTIDTPLKIAHLGIDSVLSLGDDMLLERLRKMYCEKFAIPYHEISDKIEDFRAKRITSYLNLIGKLTDQKFEEIKNVSAGISKELKEYFDLLPDYSTIKQEFNKLTSKYLNLDELKDWLNKNLYQGSVDVNIMTKLDRSNYRNGEKLPIEYNDAHAGIRGFAKSDLSSSIILSAGMNPRLYGYIENFEDFFPNENGEIKKKIVLKVSDYRSALIQGKFLAKKGLWVSEYRVESGLNCGGHAFASDGFLLGPILCEFNKHRQELIDEVHGILCNALKSKNKVVPNKVIPLTVTAQGGVGTAEEHQFLIDHYNIDSVGWATPFLLVPEVTTVDEPTREQLVKAKEDDLYLSGISPIGVPFNSLRGNTKDEEKLTNILKNRPGSSCPKKYLISNTEFTEKPICLASRQYQHLKLKELDTKNLPKKEYEEAFDKIVDKSCICVGLGTPSLLVNHLSTKVEGEGVSICPGPNMAYFSKKMSLKEMTSHIYGKINVITRTDRPNMFVKELNLYLDYLSNRIEEATESMSAKQEKYLITFSENLKEGIEYYANLFSDLKDKFETTKNNILSDLELSKNVLNCLTTEIEGLTQNA